MAAKSGPPPSFDPPQDGPPPPFHPPHDEEEGPYGFHKFMLFTGQLFYGTRIPSFFHHNPDPESAIKAIRNLQVREDDIFILAFPKSGTHWLWEVTRMLVKQTSSYETRTKEHVMLEHSPLHVLESEQSPRVFNSHLWMSHLPQEIVARKAKIIHVLRNPKDTLVSLYYHKKPRQGKSFSFDNLMKALMANNVINIQHQFDYLCQIQEFEKNNPDHPIKHIYYEEMKKDPVKVIRELVEFLQIPVSDKLCEEIADACQFDKMKEMDPGRKRQFPPPHDMQHPPPGMHHHHHPKSGMPDLNIYRKGVIGDWKNHFTVAQNEQFDEFIEKEAKALKFNFIYE